MSMESIMNLQSLNQIAEVELHSAEKNIFLFGKEISSNRFSILSKIGSLIEQPALFKKLPDFNL